MYDQLAYLGLAVVAVTAVLFLAWFGNHTAQMYRLLFGHTPKPPPPPREEEERVVYGHESYFSNCTVMCSAVGTISMSSVTSAKPGGIIRVR